MPGPLRKTARLRWGRFSVPGAQYFVTACVKDRAPALSIPLSGELVLEAFRAVHEAKDAEVLAATVMPDHFHLLCSLGTRLTIGQLIAKVKSLARQLGRASWQWQADAFEHRLGSNEYLEDYGFYIFLNPYRAGLCPFEAKWPWWYCPNPEHFRFLSLLSDGESVPTKWLGDLDEVARRVTVRE
jgi:putative transposase